MDIGGQTCSVRLSEAYAHTQQGLQTVQLVSNGTLLVATSVVRKALKSIDRRTLGRYTYYVVLK